MHKLNEEQREQIAKVLYELSAGGTVFGWTHASEAMRRLRMREVDVAYALIRPLVLAEALSTSSDEEFAVFFEKCVKHAGAIWKSDLDELLAARRARLTAPPTDAAVDQVAKILESDSGGLSRKVAVQIVAAVRKADSASGVTK